MDISSYVSRYAKELSECVQSADIKDEGGQTLALDRGLTLIHTAFVEAHQKGGRVILLGNGGSAAIASHQAFDYWKNGRIRAMAYNDASLLTGASNDFGYEHAFAQTLQMHARSEDTIVVISSSGQSVNMLNAAKQGKKIGARVITFSAFQANNPLRGLGHVNVYLPTMRYGYAELGHELILHAILDYHIENGHPLFTHSS